MKWLFPVMKNIRALIIDDEEDNIDLLRIMLNKYCPTVEVVGDANNAKQGMEQIASLDPHLVFLDIEMPGLNGIEMMSKIKKRSFHTIVVTAHPQYAIEAIKQEALDYILKPIDIEELVAAVEKVNPFSLNEDPKDIKLMSLLDEPNTVEQKLIIPSRTGFRSIPFSNIDYLQGTSGNYCVIYLSDETQIVATKALNYFEELLTDNNFFRTHRSFLINVAKVRWFDSKTGDARMISGATIPVSTRKRASFKTVVKALGE